MMSARSRSLNQCWLFFVLLHIIGSMFLISLLSLSFGTILMNSVFWVYCAYANRSSRWGILLSAIGWSGSFFILNHMTVSYEASFLMNVLLLTYMLYLHFGSFPMLLSDCHFRKLQVSDILYIICFLILLRLIASYVNALSMLIFHNYVADSLSMEQGQLWQPILALVLAPAFMEELFFRGYIFQRLGNGKKAILLSSILFALGHMNFNQMCYAFIMGLFFAVIYAVTNNLWISMSVHALFNLYTILNSAFVESKIFTILDNLSIASYHLLDPSFYDEAGKIMVQPIIVGLIISALALCLTIALLAGIKKSRHTKEYTGQETGWKPGIAFLCSCGVCILLALLLK